MARFGSHFDSAAQAIPSSPDPVTVERTVTRSQVAISVISLVRLSRSASAPNKDMMNMDHKAGG